MAKRKAMDDHGICNISEAEGRIQREDEHSVEDECGSFTVWLARHILGNKTRREDARCLQLDMRLRGVVAIEEDQVTFFNLFNMPGSS